MARDYSIFLPRQTKTGKQIKSILDRKYKCKVPHKDIPAIMERIAACETQADIARDYGVSRQRIEQIVRRENKALTAKAIRTAMLPHCPDCGVTTKWDTNPHPERDNRCAACWKVAYPMIRAINHLREYGPFYLRIHRLRAGGCTLVDISSALLPHMDGKNYNNRASNIGRFLQIEKRALAIVEGRATGSVYRYRHG